MTTFFVTLDTTAGQVVTEVIGPDTATQHEAEMVAIEAYVLDPHAFFMAAVTQRLTGDM